MHFLPIGASGALNPAWKGGLTRSTKGYWYVRKSEHPRASNGYVKRATIVLEEKLGRFLKDDELAHHENDDKEDDTPGNLTLMRTGGHTRLHHPKKRKRNPTSKCNNRYQWPSDAVLLEMHKTMSLRKIAATIGCSHKAVDRRLKRIAG